MIADELQSVAGPHRCFRSAFNSLWLSVGDRVGRQALPDHELQQCVDRDLRGRELYELRGLGIVECLKSVEDRRDLTFEIGELVPERGVEGQVQQLARVLDSDAHHEFL